MLIYKIVSWSSLPACTDVLTFFLIEEHIHFDAFPQIIHKKAPKLPVETTACDAFYVTVSLNPPFLSSGENGN